MPVSTPGIKIQNTQRWGATVELVGDVYDESYEHAMDLCKDRGSLFIHPFRDNLVQAGQGTLGLEILDEPLCKETEAVLISVGGGGLITGIGTVLKTLNPKIKIYGLTAQSAPAAYQAVKTKQPSQAPVTFTLAEGVATKKTEEIMLENICRNVDDIFSLSEESISKAISLLAEHGKMVVEGAGALPIAAILEGLIPEKKITAVLCGGNIDLPALSSVLRRGLVEQDRLVRLLITIWDRPGTLHGITEVFAQKRANILEISHRRSNLKFRMGEAAIEAEIETRGAEHTQEIIGALTQRGFRVERQA
jgi:threonine dehydratase